MTNQPQCVCVGQIVKKQLTIKLLAKAFERHGTDIMPCSGLKSFTDCVDEFRGKVMLWYNTPDHSTRIVTLD